MNSKPRSKKLSISIAILILLIGILIGGYLVLKSGRGSAGQLTDILSGKSSVLLACEPNAADSTKDSDNDGLKDWQELQIYKTDPCKPDSDGDGYLDGEEVASGYDPAKKAPGDELPGTTPKTPRPLPENLTEALRQKLSGQLFEDKISAFNAAGGLLSADELASYPAIQASIQDIIANSNSLFAPEKVDDSQIKISKDNSKIAIQNYAAAAMDAFAYDLKPDFQTSSSSESEIFVKAIENNDLAELDFELKNYQKAYEQLKLLSVPSDFLPLHKEQLNILSSVIKIYQAIRDVQTDPLKTNLALQSYDILKEQTKNWLVNFSRFLTEHPN